MALKIDARTEALVLEAIQVSKKINGNLEERLAYLANYATRIGTDANGNPITDASLTRCELHPDFSRHSFTFAMYKRQPDGTYLYWFNGGLLFHGKHDNGGDGSGPTFAVCLSPVDGWSIHT